MDREETIKLWENCQKAKQQALNNGENPEQAQQEAAKVWNQWAQGGFANDTDKNVDFSYVVFSNITPKKNQKKARYVGDDVNFSGFIFPGRAIFREAEFADLAYFEDAKFAGEADFNSAEFAGWAFFAQAEFAGGAYFNSAEFAGWVHFTHAKLAGDAWFDLARFNGVGFFREAKFSGQASFNAIRVEGGFVLENAKFTYFPEFVQANFREAPRLDNIDWQEAAKNATKKPEEEKTKEEIIKDKLAVLRALRRLAIQANNYDQEREFFTHEINVKKQSEGILFGFIADIYECFSDYGRSILRPVYGWILLGVVFTIFYFVIFHNKNRPECSEWAGIIPPEFYLAIKNNIPVSPLAKSENYQLALECLQATPMADFWFILQNLIATLLLFFFIMAIRTKFRIR